MQIKTDNALAYVSSKLKQFFAYYKAYYRTTIQSYRASSHREIKSNSKGNAKYTERNNEAPRKSIT